MKNSIYTALLAASFAFAGVIQERDPGWQSIPDDCKAPNTFNVGTNLELGQPPQTSNKLPDIFGPRHHDIPFGRLVHGKVMYFKKGEMNTKDRVDDTGVGVNDHANQSACGIPDNAYWNSKVAIHPYWLKYAGLDRYCMQDVCVSFWTGNGDDMIAKVTDICSTDPNDPSSCKSPEDIKLPRTKVQVLRHKTSGLWSDQPQFSGNEDTEKVYWYFSKCLGEAVAQEAYKGPGTSNWFSTPLYPENNVEAVQVTIQQYNKNQKSYPARGWDTYPNGITPGREKSAFEAKLSKITDWVPGQEPDWSPIAGGKGHGLVSSSGAGAGAGAGNGGNGNESKGDEQKKEVKKPEKTEKVKTEKVKATKVMATKQPEKTEKAKATKVKSAKAKATKVTATKVKATKVKTAKPPKKTKHAQEAEDLEGGRDDECEA